MSTRRAILGIIGAAPVAAGSVKAEIAAAVSGARAAGMASGMDAGNASASTVLKVPPNPLRSVYEKLRRQHQQEQEVRRNLRFSCGGLDPDLLALRSVSQSYRLQKQVEREMESQDMIERLEHLMWGNP